MMMCLCCTGLDEVLRVLSVRPESRLWDHWPSVWRCVCVYLCVIYMNIIWGLYVFFFYLHVFTCLVWDFTRVFSSCVFQVGRCFSGSLCTSPGKRIYGGRIDNVCDLRVLRSYLQQFFNAQLLTQSHTHLRVKKTHAFPAQIHLPNSCSHSGQCSYTCCLCCYS